MPPENAAMLDAQILDQLIQLQLIKSKATPEDQAAGKTQADKQWADAKTQLGSEDALKLRLKAQGLTQDELLNKWADGETAKAVLIRELKLNIGDADIKKFYDDNPADFEEPEMVHVSHILLSTMDMDTRKELPADKKEAKHKLAEELIKRARGGEDFAKLVKQYSEDPGSKDKGGEYTFPRGQMVPEFESAAFALKTNEVSDIVTTQFGYHIIKLSEHLPAQKVAFDKVAPRIKSYLTQQELGRLAPDYIAKARKDAAVEILDEKLKPQEEPAGGLPAGHPPVKAK